MSITLLSVFYVIKRKCRHCKVNQQTTIICYVYFAICTLLSFAICIQILEASWFAFIYSKPKCTNCNKK